MASESWVRIFQEAYIDVHTAYIALQRLRHLRKNTSAEVMQRDLEKKDPFGLGKVPGDEAVKKWSSIWEENEHDNPMARAMACVTACMQNHWKSWSAFMDLCPPDLKKHKISVPFDDYLLTATTVSRSTLETRARVLAEARDRHLKGG